MAPYCAIPRDYLSDVPLLRAKGVLGVSTWPIGCDNPSPFSEVRAIRPPTKGYLSDTCAILHEKQGKTCAIAR